MNPTLKRWEKQLAAKDCEPIFMLGTGKGPANFTMTVSDDVGKEFLIMALRRAIREIEKKEQISVGGARFWV
jgi:hypothetical protein